MLHKTVKISFVAAAYFKTVQASFIRQPGPRSPILSRRLKFRATPGPENRP